MERLIAEKPQYTLAVSLHAARPELRDVLVPLNRRYPVDEVVDAAVRYAATTGRRVTYEYVMIDGINDTHDDAVAATRLLRGQHAHVNLIPMNPVAHTPWQPSSAERTEAFATSCAQPASARPCAATVASTSARHAVSSPPTEQARRRRRPSRDGGSCSSSRARAALARAGH